MLKDLFGRDISVPEFVFAKDNDAQKLLSHLMCQMHVALCQPVKKAKTKK